MKRVARALLERLQRLLAPGWRDRVTARAQVEETIKDTLDTELPRAYTPEIFQRKASLVFRHVIEQADDQPAIG